MGCDSGVDGFVAGAALADRAPVFEGREEILTASHATLDCRRNANRSRRSNAYDRTVCGDRSTALRYARNRSTGPTTAYCSSSTVHEILPSGESTRWTTKPTTASEASTTPQITTRAVTAATHSGSFVGYMEDIVMEA